MKTYNTMKNNILILALLLSFSKPLLAQNDSIFPNLRGEWNIQYHGYDADPFNYLIGKLTLRKLDENFDTMGLYSYRASHNFEELLIAKIYSDSLKVYVKKATNEEIIDNPSIKFIPSIGNDYQVLYNFSLEIGDTAYFNVVNNAYLTVANIDTLFVNGEKRKRFFLDQNSDIWIQGLGSIHHPIYPIINFLNNCEFCLPFICTSLMEYQGSSSIDTFVYDELNIYCHYVSLKENELKNLKIYPNPLNSNYLTIEIDKNIKVDGYKIYDSKLCELKTKPILKNNNNIVEIDLKDLTSGFYIIEIKTDNKKSRQRFIKL